MRARSTQYARNSRISAFRRRDLPWLAERDSEFLARFLPLNLRDVHSSWSMVPPRRKGDGPRAPPASPFPLTEEEERSAVSPRASPPLGQSRRVPPPARHLTRPRLTRTRRQPRRAGLYPGHFKIAVANHQHARSWLRVSMTAGRLGFPPLPTRTKESSRRCIVAAGSGEG